MLYKGAVSISQPLDGETKVSQGKMIRPNSPSRPAAELGTTIQGFLMLKFPPSQIKPMTSLPFVMNNPFILYNEWSMIATQICHFPL